ncbi:MAG: DUF494 family protein [Bacteroidetes bacterium]|nr:DUF494 family protein [Bacteroidota bacterium]
MREKVVEILILLMSEMQENKTLSDIDLGDLKSKGYTQSEISAAFSWIFENMEVSSPEALRPGRPAGTSRRVLHDAEKLVLSMESQGYLIQLRELGLLDEVDLETVIERAMVAGYEKLTIGEIRQIVAAVLFSRGKPPYGAESMTFDDNDTIH